MAENIKKILIRGVNWIGDAVITTPAIKAVKKAFPDANISILVRPWVAELFHGSPDIDEIILYEDKFNTITGKFRLAQILRQKNFDMAILLQNAFDAALIAWLAGIPKRVGYSMDARGFLLTKAIPVKGTEHRAQNSEHRQKRHQVYYYLNLLKEAFNIDAEDIEPSIHLKKEEIHEARGFLNSKFKTQNSKLLIAINPGAAYGSAKRWKPDRFAELIRRIIEELNGNVILFGSKSEVEIADDILNKFTSCHSSLVTRHLLNMVGKTSLRQLAALISECDAFITNDSGPMHIASALPVPVVAIFGSTDPHETGPLGKGHSIVCKQLSCSPCLERECPKGHLKCMEEITADDVFNALRDILPKEKAVFLDRDGTLIEDAGYLNTFDKLKIFPDVLDAIKRLKSAGFKLIGITNQSGIARGIVDEGFVRESNAYLQKTLGIDAFYYCPHHPDDNCLCRKPEPLLLRKTRLEHGINLKISYVIGDKEIDIMLARQTGAKGILVKTGEANDSSDADFIAENFKDAADWILNQLSSQ
ncbi:MAG: lipopolysaccharide heptosyltransferase II [Nitrospirae bacterium]|nr:lipopolysaccharide heptosyltransferase II [Nitrospirota bacterium]